MGEDAGPSRHVHLAFPRVHEAPLRGWCYSPPDCADVLWVSVHAAGVPRFSDLGSMKISLEQITKAAASHDRKKVYWKTVALIGFSLIFTGLGFATIDDLTNGRLASSMPLHMGDPYDTFGLIIMVGIVFSIVGLIGWFQRLSRRGRMIMAPIILFAPAGICSIEALVAGPFVHGVFAICMMAMLPLSCLGLVLWFVAGIPSRDAGPI